jgi:hypothetical protein
MQTVSPRKAAPLFFQKFPIPNAIKYVETTRRDRRHRAGTPHTPRPEPGTPSARIASRSRRHALTGRAGGHTGKAITTPGGHDRASPRADTPGSLHGSFRAAPGSCPAFRRQPAGIAVTGADRIATPRRDTTRATTGTGRTVGTDRPPITPPRFDRPRRWTHWQGHHYTRRP